MSIQQIRLLYFIWDIILAIMFLITYKSPSLVFPFFIVDGLVLVVIYLICNANIRNAIKRYQLEHPTTTQHSLGADENLRYHKSCHPEIQKYIDERNSLTPYAIVNILLILGMVGKGF